MPNQFFPVAEDSGLIVERRRASGSGPVPEGRAKRPLAPTLLPFAGKIELPDTCLLFIRLR
jgi:hypothetical protein